MAARLGNVLFWTSILTSIVLAVLWFLNFWLGRATDAETIPFLIVGGVIVSIGWALRYVLAGRV